MTTDRNSDPTPRVLPLAILEILERSAATIRAELDAILDHEFEPWPEYESYQGAWTAFVLVAGIHLQPGTPLERNRRRCPRTFALLQQLPGVATAAFSRLAPGTHIYPHADFDMPDHVRCHLGLIVPDGALFRLDGAIRLWREGECMWFRGTQVHEAANLGRSPRTVLLCDFDLGAIERALDAGAALPAPV